MTIGAVFAEPIKRLMDFACRGISRSWKKKAYLWACADCAPMAEARWKAAIAKSQGKIAAPLQSERQGSLGL